MNSISNNYKTNEYFNVPVASSNTNGPTKMFSKNAHLAIIPRHIIGVKNKKGWFMENIALEVQIIDS